MDNTKNALAELAVELQVVRDVANRGCTNETAVGRVVGKAQRIVAELAKVGFNERGQPRDEWIACEAVENCRRIAEEGGAK